MNRKILLSSVLLLFVFLPAVWAQLADPVHFNVSTKRVSPSLMEVTFSAQIDAGWHVYSVNLEADGPTAATFHLEKAAGAELSGGLRAVGNEHQVMDPMFQMQVKYFEDHVSFVQRIKLTEPHFQASGYLQYGSCNEQTCMPPSQVEFAFSGTDGPEAAKQSETKVAATPIVASPSEPTNQAMAPPAMVAPVDSADTALVSVQAMGNNEEWWKSSVEELRQYGDDGGSQRSLLMTLLLGMLGGLLALFTPCVWPIIPMTVSFFLHRSKNRKRAMGEALLYGVSIIVIYVAVGVIVTLWKGASALNMMSTDATFNIFFFLLLVLFAASFLGGFEITLPASWNNKINQKADTTTGVLSIFLMAFTLALVSFSCTGPIIGFLLVEVSATGSLLAPTVGMFGFAFALALPFTLFAIFPSLLKTAPKSGSWMNTVKVTLGFIELAFALKFLSVADMAYGWHLLDRETFLSLWIVLFALLGLYLLSVIRFPGDDETRKTSVPRFFCALASLAFAVYMVPGLWGAPLKAVSAFAPPLSTQDFNLYNEEVEAPFSDYESALLESAKEHKPVLIDFTGKGCVNCRKMESSVWQDPRVKEYLKEKYILVSLYVDDKTPLDTPLTVDEGGKMRTLRTVGDKWSYLQRNKFGANTQPFYVLLDGNAKPLNRSYSYDENVENFLYFLNQGLERYQAERTK